MRLAVSGAIACSAAYATCIVAACSFVTNTSGLTGGSPSTVVDSGAPSLDGAQSGLDSAQPAPDSAPGDSDSAPLAQDSSTQNLDATVDASSDAASEATVGPLTYRDAVLADAPLAYWRFGESSGTVAHDETGHGYQASLGNGVTFGATGAIVGDTDTAIHLDGTDGLNAGVQFDFAGNAPFSLEGWVSPARIDNTYRHLFSKDDYPTTGREQYGVFLQATEGLGFERWVAGATVKTIASLPTLNQWAYVVGTYDGAKMTLYVNGARIDEQPDARSQLSKNTPEYVGCKASLKGVIVGSLDELAIYDHALTAARVGAHWAASGH